MGAAIFVCQHVALADGAWAHAAQWNVQPSSGSVRHHHLPTLHHKSPSEHDARVLQGTRHHLMPSGTIHLRQQTYLLALKLWLAYI